MNLNWHELGLTQSWLYKGGIQRFFASSCNTLQLKLGIFLSFLYKGLTFGFD